MVTELAKAPAAAPLDRDEERIAESASCGQDVLLELLETANSNFFGVMELEKRKLPHVLAAGEALIQIKALLGHDNWEPWVTGGCSMSSSSTSRLEPLAGRTRWQVVNRSFLRPNRGQRGRCRGRRIDF